MKARDNIWEVISYETKLIAIFERLLLIEKLIGAVIALNFGGEHKIKTAGHHNDNENCDLITLKAEPLFID